MPTTRLYKRFAKLRVCVFHEYQLTEMHLFFVSSNIDINPPKRLKIFPKCEKYIN